MNGVPLLDSFPQRLNAAIFGANGGIGGALADMLDQHPRTGKVHRFAQSAGNFDLKDETSIEAAAASIDQPLHICIVATGMLHQGDMRPEKTWRALSADAMMEAYHLNAIGPALVAKHMLPLLARGEKSVFAALSARVGSIGDNGLGGWHSYRASKAALNMLIRNFAIELARRNKSALAVGLHPGTVDTGLSKPFQGNVPDLFSPEQCSVKLLTVLNDLSPQDSGGCFAHDGRRIAE